MSSCQCLRELWRLMRVWRQDAEKLCAGTGSQQILKRRLDIHPCGNRKLASCGGDLAGGHAEMFEQGFAKARPSKWSATDREGKSHSRSIIDFREAAAKPPANCEVEHHSSGILEVMKHTANRAGIRLLFAALPALADTHFHPRRMTRDDVP